MNLSPTITAYGDRSIESSDEFIPDLFESDGETPCQFRSYYIHVILIFQLQFSRCKFRLKELKSRYEYKYRVLGDGLASVRGIDTDKTSSEAFLTSSISSGLEASTIHLRNVAILNKPRPV